jgi:hypothetical protein
MMVHTVVSAAIEPIMPNIVLGPMGQTGYRISGKHSPMVSNSICLKREIIIPIQKDDDVHRFVIIPGYLNIFPDKLEFSTHFVNATHLSGRKKSTRAHRGSHLLPKLAPLGASDQLAGTQIDPLGSPGIKKGGSVT